MASLGPAGNLDTNQLSCQNNKGASFITADKTYAGEISSTRNYKTDLALWLKRNTPENALIALHDIGAVGYFSGRKMLDMVGLVNPAVTGYYLDHRSKRSSL